MAKGSTSVLRCLTVFLSLLVLALTSWTLTLLYYATSSPRLEAEGQGLLAVGQATEEAQSALGFASQHPPTLLSKARETLERANISGRNAQAAPGAQPRGYVVALDFAEQLESGMNDLFQLADLAHSWQLQVVEPYIDRSQFSFPWLSSDHRRNFNRLSDLYDLEDINQNLQESLGTHNDLIVPLREVIRGVNRTAGLHMVLLRLNRYSLSNKTCAASADMDMHVSRLTSHLQCPGCPVGRATICLDIRKQNNFRELLRTHPLTKSWLHNSHSKIVVLIPDWHGIRTYKDRFFYWDPTFRAPLYKHKHAIRHSVKVQSAARDFALHLTPPTLGIHIRLERLIKAKSSSWKLVLKCVQQAEELVKLLRDGQANSSFLFRDYGPYGSSTCRNAKCADLAQNMRLDERFKALGVKVQEFKPGAWRLSGFSANVEQEVLAGADYLVTVGYGSFQTGVLGRWLRYKGRDTPPPDRVFQLCSAH